MALPRLAAQLGVGAIHIKDEGLRLGLGSFKALGGAYGVTGCAAGSRAATLGGRSISPSYTHRRFAPSPHHMTFACATDGNHGRSVAQGAHAPSARRRHLFVHAGVSDARLAAIARFGADDDKGRWHL